jgi:hypothetical protein
MRSYEQHPMPTECRFRARTTGPSRGGIGPRRIGDCLLMYVLAAMRAS